jgi:hypothetical protein
VTSSIVRSTATPDAAMASSVASPPPVTTSRERRGTSPAVEPRANHTGREPSRPSAAPRRALPAK